MKMSKMLFGLLILFLGIPTFLFAQKKDDFNDYELLQNDTLPSLDFGLGEEDFEGEVDLGKKEKKPKKKKYKYYEGIRTKKGFIRESSGYLQRFRFVKNFENPASEFLQDVYFFDLESKTIRHTTYVRFINDINKGRRYAVLHGPYTKYQGKEIREDGFYYLGAKHERWEVYDRKFVLESKITYEKGWPEDSEITYFPNGAIQEVIPKVNGEIHGEYYKFNQLGEVLMEGKYEYSKRVGVWREYYDTGRRKRNIQYPAKFWEKEPPYILMEWSNGGQKTFDSNADGMKFYEVEDEIN